MKKLTTWSAVSVLVMLAVFFVVRAQINTKPVDVVQTAKVSSHKSASSSSDNNDGSTSSSDNSNDNSGDNSYNPSSNSQTVASIVGAGTVTNASVTPGTVASVSSPVVPVTPVTPVTPVDPTTPATPVAPSIVLTAPAANTTVSGSVTISANATAVAPATVTSVAFSVDGAPASTSMVSPYSFAWDTTKVTNATHTITAVVTDSNGLTAAIAPVTVTVNNAAVVPVTPTTGANLVANPSFETATTPGTPDGWTFNSFGTNVNSSAYTNNGHTGNWSVTSTITALTGTADATAATDGTGDAKWTPANFPVTAGTSYKYTDWYKSAVGTEIDAAVTMTDGTTQYFYLGAVSASTDWAQASATFQMPAGAVSATIYHDLAVVGSLQIDDVSVTTYVPAPFNHAVVSLTFDDGYTNELDNGLPLLQKYGFDATDYIISGAMDQNEYPEYMSVAEVAQMQAAGMEIAAHTVHHCDLTGVQTDDATLCPTPISAAQVNSELVDSKATLTADFGGPITDFATPYGAYNDSVIAAIKAAGYLSHRSTDVGYNTADTFNPYNIKVQNITNTTTPADVAGWIATAQAEKSWLVIVYHEVYNPSSTVASDATPDDPTYAVSAADLDTELAGIKASGISVETVKAALAELEPQVGL